MWDYSWCRFCKPCSGALLHIKTREHLSRHWKCSLKKHSLSLIWCVVQTPSVCFCSQWCSLAVNVAYIVPHPGSRWGKSPPVSCRQPHPYPASGDRGTCNAFHRLEPWSEHYPGTNPHSCLHWCGQSWVGWAGRKSNPCERLNIKVHFYIKWVDKNNIYTVPLLAVKGRLLLLSPVQYQRFPRWRYPRDPSQSNSQGYCLKPTASSYWCRLSLRTAWRTRWSPSCPRRCSQSWQRCDS